MSIFPPLRYSSRLPWDTPENPLSVLRGQWIAEGRQILDLAGSNPTSCDLGDWGNAIAAALKQPRSANYCPLPEGLPAARQAVAAYYATLGTTVDPAHLLLTASTSESYSFLFQLLCNPGDEVLTPAPSYPLFDDLSGLAGIRLRSYRLHFAGEWAVDCQSVEDLISERTRAIVVVNPNNPTGSYLRPFEAERLLALCAEKGLALIADEVFWEYALAPPLHRAWFAAMDAPALCVSLGGLSKSAGMPQMKVGWMLIRGPEAERARALRRLCWIADTYLSVSAPVQNALPQLIAIGQETQAALQRRISSSYLRMQEWRKCTPNVSLLPAEGGWSAIARLPAIHDDLEWCQRFLRERFVWVQPGYYYDLRGAAQIVVSLLTPPDALALGLSGISGLLQENGS